MCVHVRYGQRELKRISRTATLGGLFLTFLKIRLVGFGSGLAVIAQIRMLTVRKRHWLNVFECAEGFALAQSLPGMRHSLRRERGIRTAKSDNSADFKLFVLLVAGVGLEPPTLEL